MATIKFSDFTNQTVDVTNTQVVGYKVGDATANYRYSMAQLSAGVVSAYDKYEFTTNIFLSNAKTIGRDNGTIRNANLQFIDVAPSGNIGFSFRDGGNDKVFIDGSGKIGVGTTDPTASIDTDGSIFLSTNASVIGRDNGIIRNANIQFADVSALGNHVLSFRDGGSDLMVVDGSGKVGIGVTDPDSFLEVFGTTTQQKWSYDADSFSTLTVIDASHTTLATGESGNLTLDAGGEVIIESNVKITGQGYTELYDTVNITLTVDWNNSNIQEITSLTGAHVFTASNPKIGATYILTLGQTGAVTPTWTGIKWPAATAPTLSGAGKTDIITLVCYDATGAGLYYGSSTLNFTT